MVEFRATISDPKDGKSYQTPVTGQHANALIGRKIGDVIDGIFVGLPGYKLQITGGSDREGFPMRKDIIGPRRVKVLVSESIGFNAPEPGLRRRKSLRGNTISPDIIQINLKVTAHGARPIGEGLKPAEGKREKAEA